MTKINPLAGISRADTYLYTKGLEYSLDGNNYIGDTEPKPYIVRSELLDYKAGYLLRYFVEKAFGSDRYPMEIDTLQAQKYNKPNNINGGLYNLATITWKLTGPLNNRYDDKGMILEMGIYEYNALQVERAAQAIPNISYVIKNYIEFARPR